MPSSGADTYGKYVGRMAVTAISILRGSLMTLATLACCTAPAASQTRGTQPGWLSGCWVSESSRGVTEEQWMMPRGGSMLGMARTIRGDSLSGYELVVIQEVGDAIHYVAHPVGQPTAVFPLKEASDTSVVFENLDHDFPQRIGYALLRADSLVAWIEGTQDGEERRVEFPYRRTACVR